MSDIPIAPLPGYLLAIPYIPKNTPFKGAKELTGEEQKSMILAVGDAVLDMNNITRFSPCKKGDIIIHATSNKTFEIDYTSYRFVHFSEVHGIWDVTHESTN